MLIFFHVSHNHKQDNRYKFEMRPFPSFSYFENFSNYTESISYLRNMLRRTSSWLLIPVATDIKKRAYILDFLCHYGSDPQNSQLNLGSRRLEKENQLLALCICKVTLASRVVRILRFSSWKVYKSYFIHIKF